MGVCFYPLLFHCSPPLEFDILPDVCHRVTHAPPCSWICFGQIHLKVSSVRACVGLCARASLYYLLSCKYTYKTGILKEVAVVYECVWPTASCHTFSRVSEWISATLGPWEVCHYAGMCISLFGHSTCCFFF